MARESWELKLTGMTGKWLELISEDKDPEKMGLL